MTVCEVSRLGMIPYADAWEMQNQLAQERSQPGAHDHLLLLQHPHVYTLGAGGNDANLLLSEEECRERGIEVFCSDRGGDITYHGPGQLVGYPIVQLPRSEGRQLRLDVRGYVRDLETVVVRTLGDYDIVGKPIEGLTGVWVDTDAGEAKICAIGVKINVKAVTKHGFALNINTDLAYFDGIIPCGIADKGVASMSRLLGAPLDEDEVARRLVTHFGAVFGLQMTGWGTDV